MIPRSLFTSSLFFALGVGILAFACVPDLDPVHRTIAIIVGGLITFAAGYETKDFREQLRSRPGDGDGFYM